MPRRAQPGLLLLMAAAAAVAVASGDPAAACAPPCAPNIAPKQCLHILQESHKDEVCGRELSPGRRRAALATLRLRHCCEHRVAQALPEAAFHDPTTCRLYLHELLQTDHLAYQASYIHGDILQRYDCAQNYSIAFTCDHCKIAYRRWICSSLVPFFRSGGDRIPPCLHLCQDVEQQCPYLLPDQTLTPSEAAHPTPQYAGEPNFLCVDPHIPRLEERANTTTGDEDCCYTHCGAPGRGANPDLYVCERCPGRPLNETRGHTTAAAAQTTITPDAEHRKSKFEVATASGATRTSPTVRWWMWWTFLLLTFRAGARLYDYLNCLTANSVRTVRC